MRSTRSTASAGSDLGGSAPTVARWLGELRSHFPSGVVRVVQQDAIDRLGLHRLLLEPEVLENVTPDVHLAATLMSLRDALPEASRQVARRVVRQVVEDIERRLSARTRAAAKGALDRSSRTSRPEARTRSTGTARSGPTCATTSPSTRRSSPSGSSATGAASARWRPS